jgi:hypothetical protein
VASGERPLTWNFASIPPYPPSDDRPPEPPPPVPVFSGPIGPAGLLQRQCACGGSSGSGSKCDECEKKASDGSMIQSKLRVSQPGDPLEREADEVAGHVLSGPVAGEPGYRPVSGQFAQRLSSAEQSGSPLAPSVRTRLESEFGRDFAAVRVHTDPAAAGLANDIDAEAFTHGSHIFFAPGRYAPSSEAGIGLLAHELVHVVQQGADRAVAANGPLLQRAPNDIAPPAQPTRDRQVACVVRLGGCSSTRDGGLPSTEDIQNYNQRCAVGSHYSGPDIFPTEEECKNPPKEPLSTGEKILLGALLIGAAAAGIAVTIAAAEVVVPAVIAAVEGSGVVAGAGGAVQAAYAYYLANAIAVNEIRLFVAGLLLACEGDVVKLLKAIAADPAQAVPILAEVYILHHCCPVKLRRNSIGRCPLPLGNCWAS